METAPLKLKPVPLPRVMKEMMMKSAVLSYLALKETGSEEDKDNALKAIRYAQSIPQKRGS